MKFVSLASGLMMLAASACLAAFGGPSFALHMVVHMTIVAVAAPLIAVGVSAATLDFSGRLTWITPLIASLIELVTVMFWHLPQIRRLADQSFATAMLEQISFFATGLLLWLSCLSAPPLAGAAGLLFTSMHMTLIGVLLALAPRPLYGTGEVFCFGVSLSAAADQQVGGVAMLLVGALSYLVGGIAILHRLVSASSATGARVR